MNLPTKFTVARLILSILIITILLFPFYAVGVTFPKYYWYGNVVDSRYLIAGVIFIIASLTDFIDGYIARKYNMVTDTGKMLDSIADKVLTNTVLVILASTQYINAIIPVVIIVRDIVVNAIKMEAAAKGKVVAAIGSGKLKAAALMVGIVLCLFYNFPFEIWSIRVDLFLLYFATIMSLVSMVEYYNLNKGIIFPKKTKKSH